MAQGVRRDAALVHVKTKTSYSGQADADVVTTADTNAQARFVNLATRWLPTDVGWRGEEGGLNKPSTFRSGKVVITVDPADGTRKLIEVTKSGRMPQAGEVSVMLGVLVDGEPIASYICDVGDLFRYVLPPYGDRILRIEPQGNEIDITQASGAAALSRGVLLRHGQRPAASPLSQRLLDSAFGRVDRDSASIGLTVTRILTGDFAAVLRVAGGYTTPWDDAPIAAMCEQGNVISLRVYDDRLQRIKVGPLDRLTERDFDMLYVGRQYLRDLSRHARLIMR